MPLWTPDRINTALWLDADDAATLTPDGSGNVETWVDKSGNANNAVQSNSARRFVYAYAALNGKNVVRGDGGTNHLTIANDASIVSSNNISFFAVVKKNLAASGTDRSSIFHTSDGDLSFWAEIGTLSGSNVDYTDGFATAGAVSAQFTTRTNNVISDGLAALLSYTRNGSGDTHSVRVDGDEKSYTYDAGDYSNSTQQKLIGIRTTSSLNQAFDGDIAEIIFVSSTLSVSDVEKVEGYLAHKWGLSASLPADHPYKAAAPLITP